MRDHAEFEQLVRQKMHHKRLVIQQRRQRRAAWVASFSVVLVSAALVIGAIYTDWNALWRSIPKITHEEEDDLNIISIADYGEPDPSHSQDALSGGSNAGQSSPSPDTQNENAVTGSVSNGCLAGGENPDKDGFGRVGIYDYYDQVPFEDCRSYDNEVTEQAAKKVQAILSDCVAVEITRREYYDAPKITEDLREVVRFDLELDERNHYLILRNDHKLYHHFSNEYDFSEQKYSCYQLTEDQAKQFVDTLAEIAKTLEPISKS